MANSDDVRLAWVERFEHSDGVVDHYFKIGEKTICYADIFKRLVGGAEAVCKEFNAAITRLVAEKVAEQGERNEILVAAVKAALSIIDYDDHQTEYKMLEKAIRLGGSQHA